MVVEPRLERELARREVLEARAEVVAQEEALARIRAMARHGRVRIPRGAEANAAEPAAAGGDLRIEHGSDGVAQAQVGGADDSSGDACLAVEPGRAHGRDPV